MSGIVQIDILQVELLAHEIVARLQNTETGHCSRVDFLDRVTAQSVCEYILSHHLVQGVSLHILGSNEAQSKANTLFILPDKAIELRNRKQASLCLFVPADLVDAAYSSIANSFALIDGRALQTLVLKQVQERLSPELATVVRAVFAKSRDFSGVSEEQKLDFALAVFRRMQSGEAELSGLELWRVGLIVDGSTTFVTRLSNNHDCVVSLSRPNKLGATTRERIQSIKVDGSTTANLAQFFHGRAMNDVRTWSHDLAKEHTLTFDCWLFPQTDASDLSMVSITPFVNAKGEVAPYCHLQQPDGINGSLRARYGARETLVVRWKTDPVQPRDLSRWRVGIVPSGSESGFEECLEERSVVGSRRAVTIKLDMEFEEPPDRAVCIRIMPLSADGNEIIDEKTESALVVDSHEFFLVKDGGVVLSESLRKSIATVPTLAFGRLDFAVNVNVDELVEVEPEWIQKDLEYFRLRLNERRVLNIGLSSALCALEKRVLAEPRTGGCFLLDVDEVRPVDEQRFEIYPLVTRNPELWPAFWRARETFFNRLKQSDIRALIEVVEWTPELAASALRYAQIYRELIDDLVARGVEPSELRQALSLDTLLIRNTQNKERVEEAVVILPTHPLRVAWFASYTQLLHEWERRLLSYSLRERKRSIDLQALRLLVPTNVPAFAYHAASQQTFTFFQNLRFFHGVALPAGAPDPHRRYGDIAAILDTGMDHAGVGDIQPDHLAEHLAKFHQLHPYAQTLVTTLINPDRGDFFAEALKQLFALKNPSDETEQAADPPAFQIVSYAEDGQKSTFQSLEKVRQQQSDQQSLRNSDHFLPGLTVTARPISQLEQTPLPEAHLAVVTDFTRPAIVASLPSAEPLSSDTSSFSLYGLVNRFIAQFTTDSQGLLWRHRIVTEGIRKPEPHPAGPRYSETLIELQTALLRAGGYLLGGPPEARPVLEVRLDANRRDLLERLHQNTNWVITLDRFFTLDYYDSPNEPGLDDVARKYVLDYSPEFTEGLGHRMMVTTSWHEEIGSLLSQAMNELGFASIEQSVSRLLHHLKMISGRLALEALESPNGVSAAVGLGVVTAWLQKNKKLRQAVLVPVDIYPRLFSQEGTGKSARGEKRCDLVLITLKRNIVDATFIEVKWRRGHVPFEGLAQDMVLQMEGSAQAIKNRFFNEQRVDGALQRSYLANVLRFYFERSRRYGLFDPEFADSFLEHVTRLEKMGLEFRPSYEGYIVSLESEPRKPLLLDNAKVIILTAKDFENDLEFFPSLAQSTSRTLWTESTPVEEQPTLELAQVKLPQQDDGEERTVLRPVQRYEPAVAYNVNPQPVVDILRPVEGQNTEVIIPLGEALGERVDWNPGVKGSPHLFILGIPGQGKSWTVTRLLSELGRQDVPALVLDFHGQFAEEDGAFVHAVRPHVLDAARGLPFSPFECTREGGQGGWEANALTVAEIFAYVAGLAEMQKDVVYTAVRDAYKAQGFAHTREDADASSLEYPTLQNVLKRIEQNEQTRHVANVVARCRPLLEMDLFRPTEQSTDLLALVRSGLVIDLHNLFAESLQMAAGAFVLRKLYKDMFRWGYAKKLRLAIVLDEAHRLAKDITLPKLMKEGRKFGIAVIVASQGMGDFHPDVLSNAGTKMIFRMNYPESRKVSGFIRGRPGQDLAERIEQLSVGSAYVQTPDMMYGSVVKMYPLEE
ncbi:MAG: ATP-binding protein [Ktedonobacteraceae bacterium]